jgi:hypothetical protein
VASGGKLVSRWKAFGIGLIGFVIVVGGISIYVIALPDESVGTKVVIGTKDGIYYSGTATAADANALGDALKADGYFQDKGVSVLLHKGSDGTILSFVVQDGIWDDQAMVAKYQSVAKSLAPVIGGTPITLRLLDGTTAVKKEVIVQ